jgi:hypothetical protein
MNDVAALEDAARTGEDRTDDFVELVRVLGGPADNLRNPDDVEPPVDLVYTCPMEIRCARVESPRPADGPPQCELRPGMMRREFW